MAYVPVYSSRINWENEPSIVSPINATNLNKMDYALKAHDDTLANWDITKANESDLLLSLKTVTYDTDTGEFVFTWWNGTTKTVDLNIEKIPVSFSMDANGVITMTTEDGTQYTADVGSLIKTYTFTDSSEIDFTVTTDGSGNKTVTASIVAGSIDGTKLTPNYLADCTAAKTGAETAEGKAEGSAEDAEAWAVGERDGVPVPSTDPAYENNAKYWATHSSSSFAGLTDTDITNPQNGQVPVYNSTTSKWENQNQSAGGGSTVKVTTSESSLYGQSVTLSDGVTTLTETFSNSGEATFSGVTLTGTLTLTSGGASRTISVPYFGNYSFILSLFTATVTVTFPYSDGASCTLSDGVTTLTATTSPMAFSIPNTGTWTATAVLDGVSKAGTAKTITTDGQTETDTIEYGTINLTYANEFRGQTITCAQTGGSTITKTAPSSGNSMTFYPNATGTWEITGAYSGTTYSSGSITVSSLSTAVSALLQTIPNGSTATPVNDVQKLLNCAGIFNKNYTTINQLLADSTSLLAVISDNNAVDYLVRSTGFAADMCADSTAMTDIGANNYCANTLLADATWCTAICNSTYFESVLNVKVPTMTSNTTPSGECIEGSSGCETAHPAWHAFDGDSSTFGLTKTAGTSTPAPNVSSIGYDFGASVKVAKFRVNPWRETYSPKIGLFGSNDNSTWTKIKEVSLSSGDTDVTTVCDNVSAYRYYCIDGIELSSGGNYTMGFYTIQFYGR